MASSASPPLFVNMAYKRKLEALDYEISDDCNILSDEHFRPLVVHLEDQIICHATEETRAPLLDIASPIWEAIFASYLKFVGCPFTKREEVTDWLLGLAVRLKYHDNAEKYKKYTAERVKQMNSREPVVKKHPLDNMDLESAECKNKIKEIAQLLGVSPHPDHLVTLSAISTVIQNSFSKEALENKQNQKEGERLNIMDVPLGFELNDPVLEKAAKILKLCYIKDLRELQTKINEIIAALQRIRSNPKVDPSLGRVGRPYIRGRRHIRGQHHIRGQRYIRGRYYIRGQSYIRGPRYFPGRRYFRR